VEDTRALAEDVTDAREDLVLEDVEVEVDESRVLVCLLQAARVQRHREAVDGIGEQVTQDRLRLSGLGQEDVDWPDWVARSLPELDEEHLAAHKLVDLGVL